MATKEEFDKYIAEIKEKIKIIQNSKLNERQKEQLTDYYLERISIAYKYFMEEEDDDNE